MIGVCARKLAVLLAVLEIRLDAEARLDGPSCSPGENLVELVLRDPEPSLRPDAGGNVVE